MNNSSPISKKPALILALEALELAAEFGGENDHDAYVEAQNALQGLIDDIVQADKQMDIDERITEPDDYHELMNKLGLPLPEVHTEA